MALFKCIGELWRKYTGNFYEMTSNTTPAPFTVESNYDPTSSQSTSLNTRYQSFDNDYDTYARTFNANVVPYVQINFDQEIKIDKIIWNAGVKDDYESSDPTYNCLMLIINGSPVVVDEYHTSNGGHTNWDGLNPKTFTNNGAYKDSLISAIRMGRSDDEEYFRGWGQYIWFDCQVTEWRQR